MDHRDWALDAPVSPRRFFASIARQRRLKRLFNATLAPDSPWLLLAGVESGRSGCGLAPLPGQPGSSLGESASQEPADSERLLVGINSAKSWSRVWNDATGGPEHPEAYGAADDEPFRDCARLGVSIVRQVGDKDLVWAAMVQDDSDKAAYGVGQPLRNDPVSQLNAEADGAGIRAMLDAAHDNGLKLVLTFMHYGAGGAEYQASPALTRDLFPTTIDRWGDQDDDGSQDALMAGPHLALRWIDGHVGQRVALDADAVDDFAYFVSEDNGTKSPTGGPWAFHYESLDPGMTYKGQFMSDLAGAVVRMLAGAVEGANYALSDVVWGIEIFNEVDFRSMYYTDAGGPDPEWTGRTWGGMVYRVARALRAALDEQGWGDVKILLPGLSSYSDGEDGQTWEDKRAFVRGLGAGFAFTAQEEFEESAKAAVAQFGQFIDAWDVHWYHRSESQRRTVLYLQHELDELRESLVEGIVGVTGSDEDTVTSVEAVVSNLVLTNFESSASATGYGAAVVPTYDWLPAWFAVSTDTSLPRRPGSIGPLAEARLAHQAQEVWRRLGGALASGVRVAGWHAWMSGSIGAFVGCGLRDEGGVQGSASAILDRTAAQSTQRPAWFSLERLAGILGGQITSARVAWPSLGSRAEVAAFESAVRVASHDPSSADWSAACPALVLENHLPDATAEWVYLLLLDWTLVDHKASAPGAAEAIDELAAALSTVRLQWKTTLGRPTVFYELDTLPDDTTRSTVGSSGELPVASASWGGGVIGRGTAGGFEVWELREPILLASRRRLAWSLVADPDPELPAELVTGIPAWLDDPTAPVG